VQLLEDDKGILFMSEEPKEMFGAGEQVTAAMYAVRYAYRIGYMRGAIDYAPTEDSLTIHLPEPTANEVSLMFLVAESKRLGLDNE
jgi:hypothetical protein